MLQKLIKILYIFISTLFFLFLFLYLVKNNIHGDIKIIYLISFLLFPFFDYIINIIKKDFYFSKVFYLLSLFLLIYTALFLFIGNKNFAEGLSIYAYYFLIIGVLTDILNNFIDNKGDLKEKVINNFIKLYNIGKNKLINYKNKVLEEIGELNKISYLENKENQSLFIKLIKYYYIKFIKNLENITYFMYILLGILILFNFITDNTSIINFSLYIFIFIYIISKILNINYLFLDNNLKGIISEKYFFNKTIFFSSLGLVFGHFLLQSLKIKEDNFILISIFILFFTIFYTLFHKIEKRKTILLMKNKFGKDNFNKTDNNIKTYNFSLIKFLKNHIYILLNTITILSILVIIGFKYDLFQNNNDNKSVNNKSNIEKNTIKKQEKKLTEKEKNKLIEKIKTSLISDEIKINVNEEVILDNKQNNNIKISVLDYYKFNKLLKIGSKNNEVKKLEEIMTKLGYFNEIPDRIFDIKTKKSLTNLLKKECGWPETTKGILGNQAQQCLYSLKINK